MKQEITQTIANAAATMTTSTGLLAAALKFADNNAAGIGAISTVLFGCIYVYFQWSSNKKLTISEVNTINIDALSQDFYDYKIETSEQFKCVNSGLGKIMQKLDK